MSDRLPSWRFIFWLPILGVAALAFGWWGTPAAQAVSTTLIVCNESGLLSAIDWASGNPGCVGTLTAANHTVPSGADVESSNSLQMPLAIGVPDLAAVFTAPATGMPRQSIPISWTVTNQGDADAVPSSFWEDRVYLSTDTIRDDGDTRLAIITQTVTLAAGSSYTISRNVVLPSTPGNYYLIFRTDMWNQVAESNESNNQQIVPIAVQAPDLTAVFTAPATGSPQQSVSVGWTVTNQGNGDAVPSPFWEDRVYLSTDTTRDDGDARLAIVTQTVTLAAGSSYTISRNVVLPGTPGNKYLIFQTDMWNQVAESNESNNQQIVPITISGTAPTVSAGGPYQVAPGGSLNLSASGSAAGGGALTFAWDLDNNGSFETSGQSVVFSAAGRTAGSMQTVVVRGCDSLSACATSSVNVAIAAAGGIQSAGGVAERLPLDAAFEVREESNQEIGFHTAAGAAALFLIAGLVYSRTRSRAHSRWAVCKYEAESADTRRHD